MTALETVNIIAEDAAPTASVSERALAAYNKRREEQWRAHETRNRKRAELLRGRIAERLQIDAVALPDGMCAVDNITFCVGGDEDLIRILGKCPLCQKVVPSEYIQDLADLGEMIDSFRPAPDHLRICPEIQTYWPAGSAEVRIIEAFKEMQKVAAPKSRHVR